jgi:hypothetical protein
VMKSETADQLGCPQRNTSESLLVTLIAEGVAFEGLRGGWAE